MGTRFRVHQIARPWKADAAYVAYVAAQASKTQAYEHSIQPRVGQLVALFLPFVSVGATVLCVGCRNRHELDLMESLGLKPVGIDLVSMARGIQPMDMHALTFPDACFDAVFACHSLEHAYDVDRALAEWRRVTKPGGMWALEVPIGFAPTDVDRHDFGSAGELGRRCAAVGMGAMVLMEASPSAARVVCQTSLR